MMRNSTFQVSRIFLDLAEMTSSDFKRQVTNYMYTTLCCVFCTHQCHYIKCDFPLQMLALRMQATSDQVKQQQETSLYSSSSDASDCGGSDGDESAEESDGGKIFSGTTHFINRHINVVLLTICAAVVQIYMEMMILI